jgi:hypothetical protein
MMKLRQKETEQYAKEAWKHYIEPSKNHSGIESAVQSKTPVDQCCQVCPHPRRLIISL